MRIITNADAFGRDEDSVNAAIECFQRGALTSATLSPDQSATQLAVEYAQKHPEFSFGVHLALHHPDPSDTFAAQIDRQIAAFHDHAIPLSHISADPAFLRQRQFLNALSRILPRYHIKRVRSAQDFYIKKPFFSPAFWRNRAARRRIRARGRFLTTDHCFIPRSLIECKAMQNWMPALTDESLEVPAHPAYNDPLGNAHRQALQSFATRAIAAGHHLITWNQL